MSQIALVVNITKVSSSLTIVIVKATVTPNLNVEKYFPR